METPKQKLNVMKKVSKLSSVSLVLFVLGFLALVQSANATTIYVTPAGATTSDGSVNAQAFFTLNTGSISLTLNNLFQNPTADGQLLSGINFNVSGVSGSGNLTTTNSGNLSTINADGSYSAGVSNPLTRWEASKSGTAISLTTLSGDKPNSLIIGPDSAGGFTQAGRYNNANSSIIQHDPSILGSATFNIVIPGVTPGSTLSSVNFQFGTAAGSNLVPGTPASPVPLPGALLLFGPGLAGLVALRRMFH